MIRRFIAAAAAALLAVAPIVVQAQTLSTAPGIVAGQTTACDFTASLCLNLTNGGSTVFSVSKTGQTIGSSFIATAGGSGYQFGSAGSLGAILSPSTGVFTFQNGAGTAAFSIATDANNTLALRNGASPQTNRVYNTYASGTADEWFEIDWQGAASQATIGTNKAGTGGARVLNIEIGGTKYWTFSGNGAFFPINGGSTAYFSTNFHTVGALETCNSGTKATRDMVTDATVAASGNFGATLTGGGANTVPVYCDGTSWKIG